jgi:hypothetical protein
MLTNAKVTAAQAVTMCLSLPKILPAQNFCMGVIINRAFFHSQKCPILNDTHISGHVIYNNYEKEMKTGGKNPASTRMPVIQSPLLLDPPRSLCAWFICFPQQSFYILCSHCKVPPYN